MTKLRKQKLPLQEGRNTFKQQLFLGLKTFHCIKNATSARLKEFGDIFDSDGYSKTNINGDFSSSPENDLIHGLR